MTFRQFLVEAEAPDITREYLHRLRRRLAQLGMVNLSSVDEYVDDDSLPEYDRASEIAGHDVESMTDAMNIILDHEEAHPSHEPINCDSVLLSIWKTDGEPGVAVMDDLSIRSFEGSGEAIGNI